MVVGTLELSVEILEAFSLKDKRRVVKSLKERLAHRFNISVAEVGDLELHNRSVIGVAMVGADGSFVHEVLQKVLRFVMNDYRVELIDHVLELD